MDFDALVSSIVRPRPLVFSLASRIDGLVLFVSVSISLLASAFLCLSSSEGREDSWEEEREESSDEKTRYETRDRRTREPHPSIIGYFDRFHIVFCIISSRTSSEARRAGGRFSTILAFTASRDKGGRHRITNLRPTRAIGNDEIAEHLD